MAIHAPITGAQTRAPSIDRRKLLGALTLIPLTAVAMPAAATTAGLDRSEWDRAVHAYNSARKAADRYASTVYRPMLIEMDRIAPRPDFWFDVPARNGQSARYWLPANDLGAYDDHASPVFREKAGAVRLAWDRHLQAQREVGYEAKSNEIDRLDGVSDHREHALIMVAAQDLAALWWKLDHLFGEGAGAYRRRCERRLVGGMDECGDGGREAPAVRECPLMGAHFKLTTAHRAAIEDQVETLLALLDAMDGDCDLEPEHDRCEAGDDGCGALYNHQGVRVWGSSDEDRGVLKPVYGADQTAGPVNYEDASRGYRAAEMGLVRTATGGWGWPT